MYTIYNVLCIFYNIRIYFIKKHKDIYLYKIIQANELMKIASNSIRKHKKCK